MTLDLLAVGTSMGQQLVLGISMVMDRLDALVARRDSFELRLNFSWTQFA